MVCVTGRDGWAEIEYPFGFVVAAVGRDQTEESWVAVDQTIELLFACDQREVERLRA